MGKIVKNFNEWIEEKASISDTETEGEDLKNDSNLEDEQDDYLDKKKGICPRCGKPLPCDCQKKDSMSAQTAVRFKGKLKKK